MTKKLTILIADDHEFYLDGLQAAIEKNFVVNQVFRAKNGLEIIEIVANNEIDLLISDVEMRELNGIETAKQLRQSHRNLPIAILTSHYGIQNIAPLLELGIHVILDKENVNAEIKQAIQAALSGKTYFTTIIQQTVDDIHKKKRKTIPKKSEFGLTKREKELFKDIALGFSNVEIANKFSLKPDTVKTHRANIYYKFEVNNAAKLAHLGAFLGLLD